MKEETATETHKRRMKMNKKTTIESLKKAGYNVKERRDMRHKIEARNGKELITIFFGSRTREGTHATDALIYCTPIFRPSETRQSNRRSGMAGCEQIPGIRAKEHHAAKMFSAAFPELNVRECGVATTTFKAGKVVLK